MGGVVFGCPALPPPVPENSSGELMKLSLVCYRSFTYLMTNFMKRPIALTPPMKLANVEAAISSSSSVKIVTRPSTALQVPWQRMRMAAPSNVVMEK